MLADPIYAGFFFHEEKRYELDKKLKRIISEEDFWIIQEMLGKKGRPRPQKRDGLYNHFMTCAHCGGHTSPDFKFQIICSECKSKFSYLNKEECPKCQTKISKMINPVYLQYTYYYCIDSKKRKTNCPESSIEQKVIDSHMADHFSSNLAISNPLSDWCIKHISEIKDKDLNDIRMIAESRNRAIKDTERKLTNLLDLRLDRSDLTSEEKAMYDAKERKLSTELKLLKAESKNDSSHERITEIDKSFDLMTEVIDTIKTGTLEEKKNVFYTFRSNLKFSGKKVDVLHTKWVSKFIEVLNSAKELNRAFEPRKTLADKEKTEVFASVIPTLLRR